MDNLAIQYRELAAEVGSYLGYGRGMDYGETTWSAKQQGDITSCVNSGLRQFYYPKPLNPKDEVYEWTFLTPTTSLSLPEGETEIELPEEFGGVAGDVTVLSDGSDVFFPIQVVGEGWVRKRYSGTPSCQGRPVACAVLTERATSATGGQRRKLWLYPEPDNDYTLRMRYHVCPDAINGALPFALGGPQHAETILQSCLAIAEERFNNSQEVHAAKFTERLMASIAADRKLKPHLFGYNGDRSDGRGLERGDFHEFSRVTVNGVLH